MNDEHVVYRFYDANDQLLYVGCTTGLMRRIGQHRAKAWWREVARVDFDLLPSRDMAFHVERFQIFHLAPKYNRLGNLRRGWNYRHNHPDGTGLGYFPHLDEFRNESAVAA